MLTNSDSEAPLSHEEKVVFSLLIVFLVIAAGGTAGLQVALFSIDRVFLRVLKVTGTSRQRRQAAKLLAVLDLQHWTLVALILLNASCMMTLPVVLAKVFDELTALIISITAVLFLGEVIPLSVFVRWAIPICAFFSPVIWLGIVLTAPVSYPVGKLLDRLLGTEDLLLDREDIAALIVAAPPNEEDGPDAENGELGTDDDENQRRESSRSRGDSDAVLEAPATVAAAVAAETARQPDNAHQLRDREVKMLQGAMLLSTDTVAAHLRVKEPDVFMVSSQDTLDRETIRRILGTGFSRVPVYFGEDRKHIIGALIVNSLLRMCFKKPDPPPLVGDYPLREVMRLAESSSLYDAYVAFRDGPFHMAVVYDTQGVMVGILTLTDVLGCLYHANPTKTVAIPAPRRDYRRQTRMRELVEGLKFLNYAKNTGAATPAAPPNDSCMTRSRRPSSPGVVVSRRLSSEGCAPIESSPQSLSDLTAHLPQFTLIGKRSGAGEEAASPANALNEGSLRNSRGNP